LPEKLVAQLLDQFLDIILKTCDHPPREELGQLNTADSVKVVVFGAETSLPKAGYCKQVHTPRLIERTLTLNH
jgi:hypothetical protein